MKRSLTLTAVVVLVGLVLVLTRMLASEDAAVASATPERSTERATREPREAGIEAPATNSTQAPSAALGRAEREAVDVSSTTFRSVRVVDARGSIPVANADVRYVSLAHAASADEHQAWDLDLCDAWLGEHGRAAVSGPDGLAQLDASPQRPCVVVATAPGRFGRALLAPKTGDTADEAEDVALALDGALRVLTLGPDGAPLAGAPVVVRSRSLMSASDWLRRPSDSNGAVTFAHVLARERLHEQGEFVAIDGLLDASVEVAIDLRALPVEPLVLRLPPTGSLDVRARSTQGPLPAGVGEVTVREAVGAEREIPSLWTRRPTVRVALVDGRALVPWLELGKELDVSVTIGEVARPTTVRARGPSRPGEVVRVEVEVGADHPILRLRAVDSAGAPLTDTTIRGELRSTSFARSSGGTFSSNTDSAGVFQVDLPREQSADTSHSLHFEAQQAGLPVTATLELSRPLESGIVDLGDLVLRPAPLLVSGRVVDAQGKGVAGATVSVRVGSDQDFEVGDDDGLEGDFRTGEDGGFVVRADTSKKQVRVAAARNELLSAELECAVGATGVLLTLLESSSIAGRVLLDERLSAAALRIELRSEPDGARTSRREPVAFPLAGDGAFRATPLRPGRYTLEVSGASRGGALASLAGIDAPAGHASADPRLAAIDLRGRVISIDLELVTPVPSDRVAGMYSVRVMDPSGAWSQKQSSFLQERKVGLVVAAAQVEIVVSVLGFRRVELPDARGTLRVELERGPLVRLRLPPDVELPPPPHYLKAYLGRSGDNAAMMGHFQVEVFGPERELTVYAPDAGPVEVRWLLETRDENSLSTSSLDLHPPQVVELLDIAGEQTFEVVVPVAALAAELGRKR